MEDLNKIIFSKTTWLLLVGFFIIRLLSFGLTEFAILENIIAAIIILALIFVYYKSPTWAFMFLLAEFFLAGSGQLLEFYGIAIRTLLLIIFLLLYYLAWLKNRKYQSLKIPHQLYYLLIPFLILILASAVLGLANNHSLNFVIQDLIPVAYLLLLIPAWEFLTQKNVQQFLIKILAVLIIGSAIWSLFNFILFTTGVTQIHDFYYKWLRDVNLGKITQVTKYYYRIVLPEHLLITPLLLLISATWLKHKNKILSWLIIAASLILALSFSRSYFLGLIVGLLILKYKNTFRNWFKIVAFNLLAILIIFTLVNFLASFSQSLGWEILGLRLGSLAVPTMEESSNNRLLLLEPINELIRAKPIIGHGLGATINFIDANQQLQTTRHFDWGYLEMWVEWGLVPLFLFLTIIFLTLKNLVLKIKTNQILFIGLLTSLISLLIINITTPALFHVLGIIYLTLLLYWVWLPEN